MHPHQHLTETPLSSLGIQAQPRVYRAKTITPGADAFGPAHLRPVVWRDRRRRWACTAGTELECGHFLFKDGSAPTHLCQIVMEFTAFSEALDWIPDTHAGSYRGHVAQLLEQSWPLPVSYAAQAQWADVHGIRREYLPSHNLCAHWDGEPLYLGFVLRRYSVTSDAEARMYARMEPVGQDGRFFRFAGAFWESSTSDLAGSEPPDLQAQKAAAAAWFAETVLIGPHLEIEERLITRQ